MAEYNYKGLEFTVKEGVYPGIVGNEYEVNAKCGNVDVVLCWYCPKQTEDYEDIADLINWNEADHVKIDPTDYNFDHKEEVKELEDKIYELELNSEEVYCL